MIKKIQTLYTKARSKPVGFSTDLVPSFLTAILLILISMFMSSCTTQEEILPGLCFSDGYGSYTCVEKEQEQEDERDMEELEPLYEACEEWTLHDGEAWMNCIMHEERRRHLLRKFEKTA